MLQTTALLGGLVAVAQAAAVQAVPAAALFSRGTSPINCGTYPNKGPSDHTRYVTPSGKTYEIDCFAEKGSWSWQYPSGPWPTIESCIDACAAGQAVPGCTYVAWSISGSYCAMTTTPIQEAQHYYTPYGVISAEFVKMLNCKDGSSNGTVFTPPGSSQKYQILCNYQYGGETLGASKRAETFEQCVGFCDTTAGCVDVVYSDAKYCWLKKTKTNGYSSGGWWSAIKVPSDFVPSPSPGSSPGVGPANTDPIGAINCFDNSADGTTFNAPSGNSYKIACNYQYDGDTIGSKYTATLELCADLCDTTAGCVDAIWSKAKYCWLKSSIRGNGYKSGGWYSAIKK
ncbi:uncharacterized protein B0I36DRAFT_366353 [Microdochium trichocladiopsis]|uniref:Apple domain-containing protein n=1 Tax=Microdochium trichocladiopsis TaxID=1682393 RepID=A0A9P8XYG8_9PEZI|nr:uncharacterized protein B0I36DRAFT_366353 [Microdochium trichocladiopsis]KAH7024405.1 hypothetical protein B0I36DRAFT_366353 [Microdochium trichocladiopsis]